MRTYFVEVDYYAFRKFHTYQTIIKCVPEGVIDAAKDAVIKKYIDSFQSLVIESIKIQKVFLLD